MNAVKIVVWQSDLSNTLNSSLHLLCGDGRNFCFHEMALTDDADWV